MFLIPAASRSAAMMTAWTPGMARAASASIERITPCATRLRTITP